MQDAKIEDGAGKTHGELLDGVHQHIEGRIDNLAEVADEMRDIRSMEESPGQGRLFDLANSYEEVADFSEAVFILYRIEEIARLPDSELPSNIAADINEAWKSLCVAATTLRFHARHVRGTAGTPIPLESAPRREMTAMTQIETAINSIADVKAALEERPVTKKSPESR